MQSPSATPNNAARKRGVLRTDLPPEWDALWRQLSPDQRQYLSEIVTDAAALGGGPRQLTQEMFEACATARLGDKTGAALLIARSRLNTAVVKWNQAAARHQLEMLAKLPTEKARKSAQRKALPGALAEEISAFKAWAEQTVGADTVVAKVNRLYDAMAIARAIPLEIASFRDLDEEALELFAEAEIFGPVDRLSVRRNRIFGEIEALFRHVLNDEARADTVKLLREIFPKVSLDIPEKTLDRLALFDRQAAMTELLQQCDRSLAVFARRPLKMALAAAQAAIGVLIVNNLAIKRADLVTAAFDGPIRGNAAVERPALMAMACGERENLDLLLEAPIIAMIDRYWSAVETLGGANVWLFSTAKGSQKTPGALTISVMKLGRRAQLHVTPQLLRDLAAKRLIEAVEQNGAAIGDEDLKDALNYRQQANFTLRFEVFRARLVAQFLLDAAVGDDDSEAKDGGDDL